MFSNVSVMLAKFRFLHHIAVLLLETPSDFMQKKTVVTKDSSTTDIHSKFLALHMSQLVLSSVLDYFSYFL